MSQNDASFHGVSATVSGESRKLALVASTGGHLVELYRLLPTLGAADDSLWITFRTPQSESLLAGRRVEYVPYVRPRDVAGVARTMIDARRLLRAESFDGVVSTGAAVALSVLPLSAAAGIPTQYIESVCRTEGPSATGRLLARIPSIDVRTQNPGWADTRWQPHASVLASYESAPAAPTTVTAASVDKPRLFVTLGTIQGYRFDAIIDAVLATGLADETTVWQTGFTDGRDLPGHSSALLSPGEFERAVAESDVVITHAGVGTVLDLLEGGRHAIVVPRRASRGEHVDDHQTEIAQLIGGLGIGSAIEADELTVEAIRDAASRRITTIADAGVALAGVDRA